MGFKLLRVPACSWVIPRVRSCMFFSGKCVDTMYTIGNCFTQTEQTRGLMEELGLYSPCNNCELRLFSLLRDSNLEEFLADSKLSVAACSLISQLARRLVV